MATYDKAALKGKGVLGEALSGAKQFTWRNTSADNSPIYFTLESIKTGPPISSSYDSTSTKVDGVFSIATLTTDVDLDTIVEGDYKWSVIIPPGVQRLKFTPTTAIPANSYYLRGTGEMLTLTIS